MLAKSPIDEKIVRIIAPSVEGMGFQLVRVRLMGGRRPTLQVMAERPDGTMEVDDCAALSRTLSAVLDVEDPIDREYVLEVSSPGIDRPLTRLQDFARYRGFEAKLETRDLIEGRKRFRGVLAGLEGEAALLDGETDGAAVRFAIPFEEIADAKLILTDALIAESLKGAGARPADGAEIDVAGMETEDLDDEDLGDGDFEDDDLDDDWDAGDDDEPVEDQEQDAAPKGAEADRDEADRG